MKGTRPQLVLGLALLGLAASASAAGAVFTPGKTVTAADGVTIRYDDQGAGEPTLLFVHGWNCDSSYWGAQVKHFAGAYRVVTLDLAGHGHSSQDRTDWTMQAFGADVATVARALDLHNIVLVGHSMGGKVVVEAANQLRDRVVAVVGADTLHNGGRATPRAEQILAQLEADYSGYMRTMVTRMFVAESDPAVKAFVLADMAAAPYASARGARFASGGYDATPVIESLQVPLILISSDYRPTDQVHLKTAAGAFEYREMTGVGHFVMMEDPQTFNNHLEAVLRRIGTPQD